MIKLTWGTEFLFFLLFQTLGVLLFTSLGIAAIALTPNVVVAAIISGKQWNITLCRCNLVRHGSMDVRRTSTLCLYSTDESRCKCTTAAKARQSCCVTAGSVYFTFAIESGFFLPGQPWHASP